MATRAMVMMVLFVVEKDGRDPCAADTPAMGADVAGDGLGFVCGALRIHDRESARTVTPYN